MPFVYGAQPRECMVALARVSVFTYACMYAARVPTWLRRKGYSGESAGQNGRG